MGGHSAESHGCVWGGLVRWWLRTQPLVPDRQLPSAGERHVTLPPSPGGAAEADPLFHHLHDLRSQAPQVPTAPLWKTEGDL